MVDLRLDDGGKEISCGNGPLDNHFVRLISEIGSVERNAITIFKKGNVTGGEEGPIEVVMDPNHAVYKRNQTMRHQLQGGTYKRSGILRAYWRRLEGP